MPTVILSVTAPRSASLSEELEREGIRVAAVLAPGDLPDSLDGVDALIAPSSRAGLTVAVIDRCDRAGVRIITLGDGDTRLHSRYGLPAPLPADVSGWEIADALRQDIPVIARTPASPQAHRVLTVWGPHGSPGRTTVAVQLATEFNRVGRHTALLDADTVAPSIALLLGLPEDAPGIAAACRRAEMGGLDAAELSRLSTAVESADGGVEVLSGLNRPSRWPELSASRVRMTLAVCRSWAEVTVVDVAAALEADEELVSDVIGPRRNAATTAALQEADEIIAVASADPLGIARFLRDHAELRPLIGETPVRVLANRVRPGPLGVDARGQIRRALERYAGVSDVDFLPFDQRASDTALLHARPMSDVTPRSHFVAAMRRVVGSIDGGTSPVLTADSWRGSSRASRWLR